MSLNIVYSGYFKHLGRIHYFLWLGPRFPWVGVASNTEFYLYLQFKLRIAGTPRRRVKPKERPSHCHQRLILPDIVMASQHRKDESARLRQISFVSL